MKKSATTPETSPRFAMNLTHFPSMKSGILVISNRDPLQVFTAYCTRKMRDKKWRIGLNPVTLEMVCYRTENGKYVPKILSEPMRNLQPHDPITYPFPRILS